MYKHPDNSVYKPVDDISKLQRELLRYKTREQKNAKDILKLQRKLQEVEEKLQKQLNNDNEVNFILQKQLEELVKCKNEILDLYISTGRCVDELQRQFFVNILLFVIAAIIVFVLS